MADKEMGKFFDTTVNKGKECTLAVSSAVGSLVQFHQNLQNCLKVSPLAIFRESPESSLCFYVQLHFLAGTPEESREEQTEI